MAKMGRPKSDTIKDKVVCVRFLPAEYARLKEYAEKHNQSVSQVIHNSIDEIISKK